jgi:hypothetical protein
MNKSLLKNDDLILRDDAVSKLKNDDELIAAAEKLKRDQRPDEVFLLYPGNRDLLEGKPSETRHLSAKVAGFGLLGLIVFLAVIGFTLHSGVLGPEGSFASAAGLSLIAITAGVFGWLTVISLKQFYEDSDFDRNGVVLIGHLSSISGHWHERRRKPQFRHYQVTLDYEVELPSGTVISDTAEGTRPDLDALDARPAPGTPVAVQYSPTSQKTRLL